MSTEVVRPIGLLAGQGGCRPTGQALGGSDGVKNVFFVIPAADPNVR